MGQDVSMYPKFHFIVIPALPATVYYEVTASNLISHNMNEVVVNILGKIPAHLKNECFAESEFTNQDAFKLYSFLILDEQYSFVAFVTYSNDKINGKSHYVAWNVCTAERYRGHKIIGKVMIFSIEYLKSLNDPDVQYVSLYVLKNNISAQKVYEKLGFGMDYSFKHDSLFRGTRALNWIPPDLSIEAQQSLSSAERSILQIRSTDVNRDKESFRTEYLNISRKYIGVNSINELKNRDIKLSEIRTKYNRLSPSVMDEIISGIMLTDQLFRNEDEIKVTEFNLDEWNGDEEKRRAELEAELEQSKRMTGLALPSAKRIEDRFHVDYYDHSEKLYDALSNVRITLDEYIELKNNVKNIEEKYSAQLKKDEIKTIIDKVVAEINDNPRYSEDWGLINHNRIVFEQELMNIEKEDNGIKELDVSLLATTKAYTETTTFVGGVEQQLIGMAYLASKHTDTCCVYHPVSGQNMPYESIMVVVKCDGRGNWRIDGPPDLGKQISECRKPFFLILLGIVREDGSGGHQNLLIYDTRTKVMERFEPHGTVSYNINQSLCHNTEKVDAIVKKWLDDTSGGDIIYVSPLEYCPGSTAFQALEENEPNRLVTDPIGFCVAWSLWYADIRLGLPQQSREDTVKRSLDFIKSMGSFRKFIRGYANHIERTLVTVKSIILSSPTSVSVQEWIIGHWYELSRLAAN